MFFDPGRTTHQHAAVFMIMSTRAISSRGRGQSDGSQGPEESSATHRMSEGCVGDFLLSVVLPQKQGGSLCRGNSSRQASVVHSR